jgi:peptidoglycan hydrolase-like protein with peptidoglycan-binding domain
VLPDRIWIARWDGKANTSTSYIREDGWRPGNRMKQYRGGHNETYGGVTINIDTNYLDLGRGSWAPPTVRRCGGVLLDLPAYWPVGAGSTDTSMVKALQCFMHAFRVYTGPVDGRWTAQLQRAANTWQRKYGQPVTPSWTRRNWVALLSRGGRSVFKIGSAGHDARQVQRALVAAGHRLALDGVIDVNDRGAILAYQRKMGLPATGVVAADTWAALMRGRY